MTAADLGQVRRRLAEVYAAAVEALDQAEAAVSTDVNPTGPLPLVIPLAKTAPHLGVSRTTAIDLANSGALPTVELPGVTGRFVRREDLETFVAGLQVTKGRRRLRSTG